MSIVRTPPESRVRPARPTTTRQALRVILRDPADDSAAMPPQGNLSIGYRLTKRIVDVVGASLLLILLSPLMLAVVTVLSVTTRGKPILRQIRVGKYGRPFAMYKFRSMRIYKPHEEPQVENQLNAPAFKNFRDPRVTRVGNVLRRLSIDELPQLWNVLRGEMSLVGPRPALPCELAAYTPRQRGRLSVTPGLTGLWQVSGRCDIREFDDWIALDLAYIRGQSLRLDLSILSRTPWSVLSCRGAY